jgi:hypothetical protein
VAAGKRSAATTARGNEPRLTAHDVVLPDYQWASANLSSPQGMGGVCVAA